MNCFQRHLNWTWLLSWSIPMAIVEDLDRWVGIVKLMSAEPSTKSVPIPDSITAIGYLVAAAIGVSVGAWVIRQKGRSLWWLLLICWYSPLWLGNNLGARSAT